MHVEGRKTSEFHVTKQTAFMAWIGQVAGIILVAAPIFMETAAAGSREARYCGVAMIIASQITKLLNSLGYQKSRTGVRIVEAENKTEADVAQDHQDTSVARSVALHEARVAAAAKAPTSP